MNKLFLFLLLCISSLCVADPNWVNSSSIKSNDGVPVYIDYSPDNTLIRMCRAWECVVRDTASANQQEMLKELKRRFLERNTVFPECDARPSLHKIEKKRYRACRLLGIQAKLQAMKYIGPRGDSVTDKQLECEELGSDYQGCREQLEKLIRFKKLDAKRRMLEEKLGRHK